MGSNDFSRFGGIKWVITKERLKSLLHSLLGKKGCRGYYKRTTTLVTRKEGMSGLLQKND